MPRLTRTTLQQENVHSNFDSEIEEIRLACENDIFTFATTINPHRLYGDVHRKILRWLADGGHNKLYLIPRDHQKSHCMAVFVAWKIACDPTATFLYLSATATLAEKQLYMIKGMLESDQFKLLWPNMLHKDVGSRDRWTNHEFNIDHPLRKKLGIRDATVTCGGLSKTITGLHPRYIVLDDIVVPDNAYTDEGRESVRSVYSQLASIESADGYSLITGTRYHADDVYNDLMNMEEEIYNKFGDYLGTRKVYEIMIDVVEKNGVFLWPKEKAEDGKEYGFDHQLLATKRAKYLDKSQFYAQYYNNPNIGSGKAIEKSRFQYYNPDLLDWSGTRLTYKGKRLNVYAAIDFASSIKKRADYTTIIVIGMDENKNIYILDIDRFKTDRIEVMLEHVLTMHTSWSFPRMAAEVSVSQNIIVQYLKEAIINNGAMISIDEFRPTKHDGSKEERMIAVLNPLYEHLKIWHREEICKILERELIEQYAAHDDVKDALTIACMKIKPPAKSNIDVDRRTSINQKYVTHSRFGGVMRRKLNVR